MARKNFAATGSFIAEDRPRALDLLGFSSQLVFNTFHNGRLHDLEHGGDPDLAYAAARAHNRGMLEFCSVDRRLLPSLYVPLVEPAACDRGHPRRPRAGRRGIAGRVRVPPDVLAQPHRSLRRVGPGPGGRHPRRVPRRRHRDPDRPGLLRQRQAGTARLPRGRGELPLRGLHGHPRPARPDPRHADLRRRARAIPRTAHRRHRTGRHLGPVVAAADGVGLRGVPTATRSGCRRCRCGRATTCTARSASRPTRPKTSGWIVSAGRGRPGHVLLRLPPRGGRPQAVGALRGVAGRRRRGRAAASSTPTISSFSWAARPLRRRPER